MASEEDIPVVEVVISDAADLSEGVDWSTILGTGVATFLGVLLAAGLAFRQYRRTRQHAAVEALVGDLPDLRSTWIAASLSDALTQNLLPTDQAGQAEEIIQREATKLAGVLSPLGKLWVVPERVRQSLNEVVPALGALGLGLTLSPRPAPLAPGTEALRDRLDELVPILAEWVRRDGRWFGVPSRLRIPDWGTDERRTAYQLVVDVNTAWPETGDIIESGMLAEVRQWLEANPPADLNGD